MKNQGRKLAYLAILLAFMFIGNMEGAPVLLPALARFPFKPRTAMRAAIPTQGDTYEAS